jgi:hypothetical protein
MSAASIPFTAERRRLPARVLAAGAVVGVLDGLAAEFLNVVVLGRSTPVRVFQGVARAVLGPAAFDGGGRTFALGLALHFAVALTWAALYAAVYERIPALRRATRTGGGAVAVGVVFGPLVWLVMRFAVLPLTQAATGPVRSWVFLAMLVVHMLMVGLPIALLVRDEAVD